ncbi:hypothetical protein CPB84DRAFT_1669963 [Gymnopilus junonius]|uniref:SnoaL-like domain-containing protein n=1 Tax=Gymnopilus junonius TaxID=109634 RepID=A0A9P5P2D9_GYMJU|nr:hypothetical protein CPB84DRAFT_1669963 [Gymnopilus junonius]
MFYDPNSPNEQPVPLPSPPLINVSPDIVVQPPLSRRGTGPGVVLYLPNHVPLSTQPTKPLDPVPIAKWAEEGFAVAGITASNQIDVGKVLEQAIDALVSLEQVDIKDKFAVISTYQYTHHSIVYDIDVISAVFEAVDKDRRVAAFVGYGSFPLSSPHIPALIHLKTNTPNPVDISNNLITSHIYRTDSNQFVLPQAEGYDPGNAALAHTRTLVFLRKHIGGPFFDLEAIWDEHTFFEFQERSVARTMGTMVAEPYVNHIPTMTGGIGRDQLTAFYRDHFIFQWEPPDVNLQVVSRTIGPDRVIDEFVYQFTHDRTVDWLLPGVPPTGKQLDIPMIAVVNVRGDRLYNEHIWWDQATVLRQAGILPSHLPFSDTKAEPGVPSARLRLPVAGVESAQKLINEIEGRSNEMFGPEWGIQTDAQMESK